MANYFCKKCGARIADQKLISIRDICSDCKKK